MIEKFGCHLLFLPTDSPDFNLIEHWWHKIKFILRRIVQQNPENLHQLLDKRLSQSLSI
ncbi:transposase [Candidatus Bealeia paramacronuclearis]|uniref:transposase n=1 Tax=Candidatus Bealeia paramacronuclearis TaxID=1921001 RepID=UPI0039C0FEA5